MEDKEFFEWLQRETGQVQDEIESQVKRMGQAIDVIASRALYDAIVEMTPERRHDVSFLLRISPVMVVPDSEPYSN